MNNEIKEILDNMKKHLEKHKEDYQIIVVENGFSGDSITYELYYDDLSLLLDYITNLQTIEQQYSAILSENAELENKITNLQDTLKDREEYCYGIETQITNLQEELKYQKQAEQEYNEKHTKLMKKYKELQEEKDRQLNNLMFLSKIADEKQDKIDKAIEYIKNDWYELNTRDIEHCINLNKDIRIDLLNILQEEDK